MKRRSMGVNAILNSIKTIMSMIFPLITFPYVSRVLQVENIGKVNFSNSVVSYFLLLAGLGIATYASREGARLRDDKEQLEKFAAQMFSINLISAFFAYVLLGITIWVIPKFHSYVALLMVHSLSIVGTALGVEWLYIIEEDYLYITIRSILVQLISIALLFVLVKNPNDYIVYAAISTFANTAANIFNFIHSKRILNLKVTTHLDLHKHLPSILTIFFMAIATTIYVNSDSTMLGFMKNDYYVGLYGTATKIYMILKSIMSATIIVTLPRLSNLIARDCIDEYQKRVNGILNTFIMLLLPTVMGVFLSSKEIIEILAGNNYSDAAKALQILSLSLLFSIFAIFYTNAIMLPLKMEKIVMTATICSAIVNIGLNIFFIPKYSHVGASITTAISEALVLVIMMINSKNKVQLKYEKNTCISALLGCVFIVGVCLVVNQHQWTSFAKLLIKIGISSIGYLIVLIVFKNKVVMQIISSIHSKMRR